MDVIYYSIIREASQEIKVKGSRFIGRVKPVTTIEKADEYIDLISTQYYDATHNCTAYRIGLGDKAVYRYNDDGEPSGTGGRPILEAIEAQNLTNIVSVVTRYFGGIKLGTGGLSRAYRSCAEQTLKKAGKRKYFLTVSFLIKFPYEFTGIVMDLMEKNNCIITEKKYSNAAEFTVSINKSQVQDFKQVLLNKTGGKITIREKDNESI